MSTICCPPTVVPQRASQAWRLRQGLEAVRGKLLAAWRDRQARRRVEADLRLLRALDAATLRDLGLEHLVPPRFSAPTLRDRGLGRW